MSEQRPGEGHKILVVEDDPAQLRLMQLVLHRHNYHCAVFSSAEEALEGCEPSLLAAAILDMELPGVDGVELGRILKERVGANVFLPVIMVSGHSLIEDRVRGFRGGCDDFLSKPINHFELCVRLESLIARRAQQAELVRVNAALTREHKLRGDLVALIVHDLRNPLSAIMGNIQLLSESCPPVDSFMEQCISDVNVLSIKALSMVNGLLDVKQLEEGLLAVERTEIDLAEFISHFPKFYETATSARKLTLNLDVQSGLRASFDRQLIGRILENLLDNAVRYAKHGGRVELKAYALGEDLVLEVGNTGPPVPEGEIERIFERYYRVDTPQAGSRTRGLGLYFCRLAAEAHEGKIVVISRDDFPTCFVVRLPKAAIGSVLGDAAAQHFEV